MIVSESAGLEDDVAQLGDAAATRIIEVDKRKPGPGIASCNSAIAGALGRRCLRARNTQSRDQVRTARLSFQRELVLRCSIRPADGKLCTGEGHCPETMVHVCCGPASSCAAWLSSATSRRHRAAPGVLVSDTVTKAQMSMSSSGSHATLCWREMDSNYWYRVRVLLGLREVRSSRGDICKPGRHRGEKDYS